MTDKGFARPSSTVILLREGSDEPELFMVRRHADASFGAAYAFPGGVMDASDSEGHEYCEGRTAAAANTALGLESGGLNYLVGAIRE
ncbi:MAG: NUDIX hydrolase, partial [Proteobacteria bacterium]|nr:NUDIX hydrolase [Pseudomonadota bacterium]